MNIYARQPMVYKCVSHHIAMASGNNRTLDGCNLGSLHNANLHRSRISSPLSVSSRDDYPAGTVSHLMTAVGVKQHILQFDTCRYSIVRKYAYEYSTPHYHPVPIVLQPDQCSYIILSIIMCYIS